MNYWPLSSPPYPMCPPGNMQFPMWTPGPPPSFPLMMRDFVHPQHAEYVIPEVSISMISPDFAIPSQQEQQQQVCNKCTDLQAKSKDFERSLKTSESQLEEKKTELLNERKSKDTKISILEEQLDKCRARQVVHDKAMDTIQASSKRQIDGMKLEVKNLTTSVKKKTLVIGKLGGSNEMLSRKLDEKDCTIRRLQERLNSIKEDFHQQGQVMKALEIFNANKNQEDLKNFESKMETVEQENFELRQAQVQLTEHNRNLHQEVEVAHNRIRELEAVLESEREQHKRDLTSRKRLPQGSPACTPNKIPK